MGDFGISIKPHYSEFVRGLRRFSLWDDPGPRRPRVGHHPPGGEAEAVADQVAALKKDNHQTY